MTASAASTAVRGPLTGLPLTRIACPLCGDPRGRPAGVRNDGVFFAECAACGLAYANPAPAPGAVSAIYRGDYFGCSGDSGGYRAYEAYDAAGALAADPRRWEVGLLEDAAPPEGVVVEVGCGSARLLEAFQRRGWRTVGVELNPRMAERARRRLGAPVFEKPLEDGVSLPSGQAAIVAALSVVEHTPRPAAFFDEIARLLARGGLLLIATPNWDAAAVAGSDWIGWRGQWDHVCYFSPASLARALEPRGFTRVAEGSSGPPAGARRLARRRPLKRFKRALQGLPGLGAKLTDWKRRLRPPRLEPLDPRRADYVALYRRTP